MANRARAFGMKIQYHNRSRLPPELEGDATYVSFDELLANSDVLSLNLALNESTRHIIGEPEFKKMKDGVVIVNTARGALIDEKALVAALDSGKVVNTQWRKTFFPFRLLTPVPGCISRFGRLRERASSGTRPPEQPQGYATATYWNRHI